MANFENEFIPQMQSLFNQDLLDVIHNKNNYRKEAYEAAVFVAIQRKLITENEGKSYLALSDLESNSEEQIFSNSDVKNGLNNLFTGYSVFFAAFIIATALNLNFDDPKIGKTIIGALSLLCLFFKVNFFPNKNNEDSVPNRYSEFATWFAEPFIDKRNFRKGKYDKLKFRRNFINLIIILPFFAFNFTLEHEPDAVEFESYETKNSYTNDMKTTQSKINNMTNEIETMRDSFNISYSVLIKNEGDNLFVDKNYLDALKRYKNALNYNNADTSLYLNIGNCFLQLKQEDSARYYWEKAELLGSLLAKKKLKKLK